MKTCIQTLRSGVEELLSFLASTEHEAALIGLLLTRQQVLENQEKQLLARITGAHTNSKRYVYAVAIVSLYGLFERFIDTLIEAFVDHLAEIIGAYEMMPEIIKRNHVSKSLDLAQAVAKDRHRAGITQETIIANLHSCFSGTPNFRVNTAAFVVHRGNLTLGKVAGFLSSIGVKNHLRRMMRTRELMDFLSQREPERDFDRVADQDLSALFEPVDDLVKRRNEISHGVIDDIVSTDLLKDRCCFLSSYCDALYEVMVQELMKYQVLCKEVQPLGKPIKVYNESIVCFESNMCHVAVGNILAAATGDPMAPFRFSPIISLEVHNKSVPEINTSQITQFGAKVSFKATDGLDYYVLPDEMI